MKVVMTGFKELQAKLKELPRAMENKILRKGCRAGAKIIQARAIELCPVWQGEADQFHAPPGTLKANIKVRAGKRRRGRVSVVVRSGAATFQGEDYYGGFVEWGHRIGRRPGKATEGTYLDKRGSVPAKPFMRPALDETLGPATEAVRVEVVRGVNAEAAKTGGSSGGDS